MSMEMKMLQQVVICICVSTFLFGCASLMGTGRASGPGSGVRLSDVRGGAPKLPSKEMKIDREKYRVALTQKGAMDRLRILEVFENNSTRATPYPEYRLFNVAKNSPYHMLGIRDGDILVAANDWVVFDPRKFKTYVQLLGNEKDGQIEIRRNGKPLLIKYSFVQQKGKDS